MNVTVDVSTSSLISLLNQKEPTIPIKKPNVGPPPASLMKFNVTPVGVASYPFSIEKKT